MPASKSCVECLLFLRGILSLNIAELALMPKAMFSIASKAGILHQDTETEPQATRSDKRCLRTPDQFPAIQQSIIKK